MGIEIFFCANRYAKTLTSNNLTFTELAKLFSQPFVSKEKDGSGIFPGHYTQPFRQLQYIDYHNFVILDIDDHQQSEKLLSHVRNQTPYLFDFNFIIYSTFSSKSDKLRLRLILEINTDGIDDTNAILIDDYPAATRTVEAKLGLIVDPASHKRNSFVYSPRIPPTNEYIYYYNLNKNKFTKHDIDAQFYSVKTSPYDDFADFKNDRDNNVYDPEEIPTDVLKAMLNSISPDCDYELWLKMIFAMHNYSNGATWGYDLINEWSSKGKKYEGNDSIWYKWLNIAEEAENPVTIGTLIYHANQNHWHGQYVNNIASTLREEIAQNREKFVSEEYIYAFAKKLSKYQFTPITRSILVGEIIKAATVTMQLDKKIVTKLTKEVENRAKYGGLTKDMTVQERKESTPVWAREFVIITGLSNDARFANINNPFDPEIGSILLTNDIFNAINIHHKTEPNQDLALLAREYFDIPHVQTIKFDPYNSTIFYDRNGKSCLNSFVRNESFYYGKPNHLTDFQKEIILNIERFMEFFLPDVTHRTIFLNYIAHNVFFIGKKVQWAPLIITSEGYGKDTMMHLMEVALGKYRKHFLKLDGVKFFDPQWTSILEHRSFVHVNEVYVTSQNIGSGKGGRERIYNVIKDRITDADSLRISAKYQADRVIQQVTNYSFTSNALDAITFPNTERRLLVLWPERYHDNFKSAKENSRSTIKFIWNLLHEFGIGGHSYKYDEKKSLTRKLIREAILAYFGEYSIQENWHKEFKPSGEAYRTKEFFEMANLNRDQMHDIIEELIESDTNAYVTPFYICLTPLLHQLSDEYRTRGLRPFPIRSDVIMYLKQRKFVDIADLKSADETNLDFRAHMSSAFGGSFNDKSKIYVAFDQRYEWFNLIDRTPNKLVKVLHNKWLEYVKYREFYHDSDTDDYSLPLLNDKTSVDDASELLH